MARKLKSSSLADFSTKLVRFHKLPNGTEIRLYRKKTERRVRSDLTVKRKGINSKNIEVFKDSWNVRDFLDEARALLSTDVEARGLEMQLFAPDGSRIYGNTLLGNVRKLEPKIEEDSGKPLNLFLMLLENSGLEDISLRQAGNLYRQINEIIDSSLEFSLLENESKIISESL
ncbi:hypothetical protein AWH61_12300 [Alteromonas sp. W12]|nr:hypothetical protein MASE_18375 [Alteromonas macleodii ATCC 27126]OLF75783.1 hypothetical protein AWH61_12300 [Alteromonas sp. W12]